MEPLNSKRELEEVLNWRFQGLLNIFGRFNYSFSNSYEFPFKRQFEAAPRSVAIVIIKKKRTKFTSGFIFLY